MISGIQYILSTYIYIYIIYIYIIYVYIYICSHYTYYTHYTHYTHYTYYTYYTYCTYYTYYIQSYGYIHIYIDYKCLCLSHPQILAPIMSRAPAQRAARPTSHPRLHWDPLTPPATPGRMSWANHPTLGIHIWLNANVYIDTNITKI